MIEQLQEKVKELEANVHILKNEHKKRGDIVLQLLEDNYALRQDISFLTDQQYSPTSKVKVDLVTTRTMEKLFELPTQFNDGEFMAIGEIQSFIELRLGKYITHVQLGSWFSSQGIKRRSFKRISDGKRGVGYKLVIRKS